jgi:hypothetical protein
MGTGAFQEAGMTEAKSNAVPLGGSFVKEAEAWIGAQGDVLARVEAMINGWAQRQRQAYEASARSLQKMCEARNMFDVLQAQHEWLSDCLNWTASEIRAAGNELPSITRMAVGRLDDSDNGLQPAGSAEQHAPNIAVERVAAE